MKRFSLSTLLISMLLLTIPACAAPAATPAAPKVKTPKYVFLFIGDGMGFKHVAATEAFKKATTGKPLAFTAFPVTGEIATRCANKAVTDSAAAGTALACGTKVNYHVLGIDPKGKKLTSVATIVKAAGMRVGITTSVTLNHATPAAFYAHAKSRNLYDDIAKQLPGSKFDFFAAGDVVVKKLKHDAVYKLYRDAGYSVVFGREGLAALKPGTPAIALHKAKHSDALPRHILAANKKRPDHITLPDITEKAIELLDNPKGFFLMVEGGAIDWASHANAGATTVYETLDFDAAVAVAMKFYRVHPADTLIIVTADHETGGMRFDPKGDIALLAKQAGSDNTLKRIVSEAIKKNVPFTPLLKAMETFFGLEFTGEERTKLEKIHTGILTKKTAKSKTSLYGKTSSLAAAATKIANQRAGITWQTGGHSSANVPVYAIGTGSEHFTGKRDNTYIAIKLKQLIQK